LRSVSSISMICLIQAHEMKRLNQLWSDDLLFARQTLKVPNRCGAELHRERSCRSSIDSGTCTVEDIIERCDMELEGYPLEHKSTRLIEDSSRSIVTVIQPLDEISFECCVRKSITFDYRIGRLDVDIPIYNSSVEEPAADKKHEWVQLQVLH
jgi:hypothetical protein